jgi:hypothetical protein
MANCEQDGHIYGHSGACVFCGSANPTREAAIDNARRYVKLPTVDADSKRIIMGLLERIDGCRCDCVNCVTGNHEGCYYRPSVCPVIFAQRDMQRCEGRYPVPATSPPRNEPFDVTYRCSLPKGHDGPHRSEP